MHCCIWQWIVHAILSAIFILSMVQGVDSILCPEKVRYFSSKKGRQYYHECKEEGSDSISKVCSKDQLYLPRKEGCHAAANGTEYPDITEFTQAGLGRLIFLGGLFDGQRNEILVGRSLWSRETVDKYKWQSPSRSVKIEFWDAPFQYDRVKKMKFDAALQTDVLSDLVEVTGSESFIKDSVNTEDEAAVILRYRETIQTDILPMYVPIDYTRFCSNKATHVITSVQYGMSSNFVFTQKLHTNESVHETTETLLAAVESIPQMKGGGELKEIANVKVQFFSDFILNQPPTTFDDAVIVYKALPKYYKDTVDNNNLAITKMTLTPIHNFCDKTETTLIGISPQLENQINLMFKKIQILKTKSNTLLSSEAAFKFRSVKVNLNKFQNKLNEFEISLKDKIRDLVPKIRAGQSGIGESDLVQILQKYKESPFYYEKSKTFLQTRLEEINILNYIISKNRFKGGSIGMIDVKGMNDKKVLFEKHFVTIFQINIMPPQNITEMFIKGESEKQTSLINDPSFIAKIGLEFNMFTTFYYENHADVNRGYLIKLSTFKDAPVNIYALKDGQVLETNFHFPKTPHQVSVAYKTHDKIYFEIGKPKNDWISSIQIIYWKISEESNIMTKVHVFKSSIATMTVDGLEPNQIYQITTKYVTTMGKSQPSERSLPINTLPCSPPTGLKVTSTSSNHISLKWDIPKEIGNGITITMYKLSIVGKGFSEEKEVRDAKQAVFTNLPSATVFNISVKVVIHKKSDVSSLETTIKGVTLPRRLSTPSLQNRGIHSAEITWSPSSKILPSAVIKKYLVKYTTMNRFGNVSKVGSEIIQSSLNHTSITLKGLVQGTTYGVAVKIITTGGNSQYSPLLIIETLYRESEMDNLNDTLRKYIEAVRKNIEVNISSVSKELTAGFSSSSEALKENRNALSTSIKDGISTTTKLLSNKMTYMAKRFKVDLADLDAYRKYRWYGCGYGNRANSVGGSISLAECFIRCSKKKSEGSDVRGVTYVGGGNKGLCYCDIGSFPHTHSDGNCYYLHYQLK